jgi:transposase
LCWLERIGRRLARLDRQARGRVARELVRRVRELTRECSRLEAEIGRLVRRRAPQLLALQGCGTLTAAKILAETADVERFPSEAHFARHAGVAPIPASSGRRQRHRLDRGGNRQLNCALHRIAVVQGRSSGPAADYLAGREAEGKSRIEALRCLKRHFARVVFRLLTPIRLTRSRERVRVSTAPLVPCLT